jgi:hypothetical protein
VLWWTSRPIYLMLSIGCSFRKVGYYFAQQPNPTSKGAPFYNAWPGLPSRGCPIQPSFGWVGILTFIGRGLESQVHPSFGLTWVQYERAAAVGVKRFGGRAGLRACVQKRLKKANENLQTKFFAPSARAPTTDNRLLPTDNWPLTTAFTHCALYASRRRPSRCIPSLPDVACRGRGLRLPSRRRVAGPNGWFLRE